MSDKAVAARTLAALRDGALSLGGVLGILGSDPAAWLERRRDRLVQQRDLDRTRIEGLLAERAAARKAKDFQRSDALRADLDALGVEVRDGPTGTTWKVKG